MYSTVTRVPVYSRCNNTVGHFTFAKKVVPVRWGVIRLTVVIIP